jgi:methyl-accepting chemotaxis protein
MKEIKALIGECECGLFPKRLRASKARLIRFQTEFEQVFLVLARNISEIHINVTSLQNKIEDFRASEKTDLVAIAVSRTQEILQEYRSDITTVVLQNTRLQTNIRELALAVDDVSEELKSIDQISGRINLASINSSIVALGAGKEGLPFSVLAKDLREVVKRNVDIVRQVGERFAFIHTHTESIKEMNSVLDQIFFEKSGDALEKPAAEILSVLKEINRNLDQVTTKTHEVLNTLRQIMVIVQKQDILRQGIQHVSQAFESLEEEYVSLKRSTANSDDELCARLTNYIIFQERIGLLSASLLDSCKGDLSQLYQETIDAMTTLYSSIDILYATKDVQSTDITKKLAAPVAVFESATQSLMEFNRVCSHHTKSIIEIDERLKDITKDIEEVNVIKKQVGMHELMMRIEIARTGSLRNAGAVMDDVRTLIEQLGKCTSSTKASMLRLRQPANEIMGLIATSECSHTQFESTNIKLREHPKNILAAGEAFVSNLGTIVTAGEHIKHTIRTVENELKNFKETIDSLDDCMDYSHALVEAIHDVKAEAVVNGYYVNAAEALSSKNVTKLLDRFTMLTHKKIGGEIANVEVDDGDAGGTLTLF